MKIIVFDSYAQDDDATLKYHDSEEMNAKDSIVLLFSSDAIFASK